MTKHDADIARMYRYVLRGYKFEYRGTREYQGKTLKVYRTRNDWFWNESNFYVEAL